MGQEVTLRGYLPWPCVFNVSRSTQGASCARVANHSDLKALSQFLGLASYFCQYIHGSSGIAAPLQALTGKQYPLTVRQSVLRHSPPCWTILVCAPVLAYPQFYSDAGEFILQTDASAVGLGAVLEQDRQVIMHASWSFTTPE